MAHRERGARPGLSIATAALLLAAVGVIAVVWWGAGDIRASEPPAPAAATANAPAVQSAAPVAGNGPPAAEDAPPVAATAQPQDPHTQFMQAVKAAREKPLPAPVPAIARARSLPEAFEAMRAAQREADRAPPPGSATLNPFAAAAK